MKIQVHTQRADDPAIRSWGLKNGFLVGERGPVAWDVRRAYEAALEADLATHAEAFAKKAATWPVTTP